MNARERQPHAQRAPVRMARLVSSDRPQPVDRWNEYAAAALGFLVIGVIAAVVMWGLG